VNVCVPADTAELEGMTALDAIAGSLSDPSALIAVLVLVPANAEFDASASRIKGEDICHLGKIEHPVSPGSASAASARTFVIV
jgi:hypothetical protein